MAKLKRLKPRKNWTNRLAWAVWKIAQNNKKRANGSTPIGDNNLVFQGDTITFMGDSVVYT